MENTKNLTENIVLCMKEVSQKSVKPLSEITDKTLEVSQETAAKLKKIGEILLKME